MNGAACNDIPALDRLSASRWQASMQRGDFEAAWRESDAVRARGAPDPHRYWNGEDLRGARVVVRCLHGLGDAVQMFRYAPLLRQVASSVVYEVPPSLQQLAPLFHGVEHVITWGKDAPALPPPFDVQVEIMELPYLFRTTLPELPLAVEYLQLPPGLKHPASRAMGRRARPRVGIVWAAGDWNPGRSLPPRYLSPLLATGAIDWWSLQGGEAASHLPGAMRDATAICGEGLPALAATIANLDLVLTVDTLAAHLAGALGTPAWVMLQHTADWRWMTGLRTSPWYPSLRLFRQRSPGDWPSVIQSLQHEFLALTSGARTP